MKVAAIMAFHMLAIIVMPALLPAQNFIIDTTTNTVDVSREFNDIEVHLASVKKLPEFTGGKKAWQDFLRSNINIAIPFTNKAPQGAYRLMIRFIIESDGKFRGIGADTNCGFGMESEVIRCIQKSPPWIPAETSSGKKVSFTMRTIVIFLVK